MTINPFDNPLADYAAEVFNFSVVSAQYFRLELSGCPQPDPGSFNGCAIGEIAFRSIDTPPIPIPAAAPLLLSGLAAFGFAARRRRRA
jgi:hypothetical protein